MAKKKNITEKDLLSFYMDYVLEHNEQPKSVYAFCKLNNFDEAKFYDHFSSFEALEKSSFTTLFSSTMSVIENNEEYKGYDARHQLLTFYFTFFENLTANRSFIVYLLKGHNSSMKSMAVLKPFKNHFKKYIAHLDIHTLDLKEENLKKLQQRSMEETAWVQLLFTVKFWLDDTSSSFEKTDVFIEKSVNTSFDLIDTKPLKSLIDFGKFMYKEKFHQSI